VRSIGHILATVAFAGLAIVWAVVFRPQWLGGPATYVMVRGDSMLPTLETGDLVITESRAEYRVGDVVAYRVPSSDVGSGLLVIHRICGGDGRRGYVLQGDNNSEPDPWQPTGADIVGVASFRIPEAGTLLGLLHDPATLASLGAALVVILVLMSGPHTSVSAPQPSRYWRSRLRRVRTTAR
jgi:signal peptidase I